MAKQQSGEGKAPLVIALVFFVIATITCGVLAYMFNSDLATAKLAQKEAEDKAKLASEMSTKSKEAMLIYKIGMGVSTDQDRTDLQGIRFKDDARKAHADMVKGIDDRARAAIGAEAGKHVARPGGLGLNSNNLFVWDWPAGGDPSPAPNKGLIDAAVTYFSQSRLAESNFKTQSDSLAQAQLQIREMSTKLETAQKQIDTRMKEIPEEIAKGVKEARDQFEKFKIDFNKLMAEQRGQIEKGNEQLESKNIDMKRAQQKIDRIQNSFDQLMNTVEAKVDPFQFDKPQGKILRRNAGSIVEIDLGSADNLRAGLTFSVMPADTPQRGFETRLREVRMPDGSLARRIVPKGSIEVIEVLGPNLSQARITDEDSQVRDRVLTGDLLYNAIWRRGTSEHIVLYGIFDLDGDGRDDIKSLRDELTKMGVSVDAYFDLATLKWVGDVTTQTTFAVEGYSPTTTLADGHLEGKSKIISAIAEARKATKDKGVRILRPRDFFPRIGYKAKLDVSENTINQAATFFIRTLPASEGGGGETPAAIPPKVEK